MLTFKQFLLESKYPLLRKPVTGEQSYYNLIGYHSTNLDNWDTIKSRGLIPGKSGPAGQSWAGKWSGKAIYYHLTFPIHEIDNSYDRESGEPFSLVIETRLDLPSGYFVPDEDVTNDLDKTEEVIESRQAIAVGFINPPNQFVKIHMIDTPQSREWAINNVKRWPVEFHK